MLQNNGVLLATGCNEQGQFGIGNNNNSNSWIQVAEDIQKIAAGKQHSIILKTDNTLWATGNNDFGQLGIGNTISSNVWVKINN